MLKQHTLSNINKFEMQGNSSKPENYTILNISAFKGSWSRVTGFFRMEYHCF